MKRLLLLQIIGCILFAGIIGLLCAFGLFSPVSTIVVYVIMGMTNVLNARVMLMKPIEHISIHDKLTGCHNRTKLESKIREYEKFRSYAIIFFDVNNLKKINDVHGHNDGDRILIRASDQLRFWHKYGDLYRLGGDEFIVVVTNMTEEELEPIITEWYSSLPSLNEEFDDDFVCSLSYGISYKVPERKASFKTVMEDADEKMYDMKRIIKNGAV